MYDVIVTDFNTRNVFYKVRLLGAKSNSKYNLKNIITPGFINTRKYFTKCDVYVFPSLLEGSSKSIYDRWPMPSGGPGLRR